MAAIELSVTRINRGSLAGLQFAQPKRWKSCIDPL